MILLAAAAPACRPPAAVYPEALHSESPDQRAAAACLAAERRDRDAVPLLVDRLDDDDEAVRMFAILALERITGTRLGYAYHAPEPERLRAIERWRRYLLESRPAEAPSIETGGSLP